MPIRALDVRDAPNIVIAGADRSGTPMSHWGGTSLGIDAEEFCRLRRHHRHRHRQRRARHLLSFCKHVIELS